MSTGELLDALQLVLVGAWLVLTGQLYAAVRQTQRNRDAYAQKLAQLDKGPEGRR